MNIENINKLIEFIRTDTDLEFNMAQYVLINPKGHKLRPNRIHTCGSASCIAGYIDLIRDNEDNVDLGYRGNGQEFLGIDAHKAGYLFDMRHCKFGMEMATREDAVKVLECLRDTGNVQWSQTIAARLKNEVEV